MAYGHKIASTPLTEAEYLAMELTSEEKHEYIDGQAFAMAGASIQHGRIAMNFARELSNHLKGKPCEAFISDIKTKVGKDYYYPDVFVDCSVMDGTGYISTSPVIVVEVLSKSTRKLDLTTKLLRYISLPSLQEYVLIEQGFVTVQVLRKSSQWMSSFYFLGDSITFESIGLTMTVEDIYDRVDNADMNEFRLENGKFD